MFLNVWQDIAAMPAVEVVAAACGVLSVWFARGNSIWVYPTGIVSVTLYILICLQVGLYADSLINAYYLFMSIYGWYFWLHGGKIQAAESHRSSEALDDFTEETGTAEEKAHISYNTLGMNLRWLGVTALVYVLMAMLLSAYTDSDVAWIDAFTTAVFLTAMYAMARKKLNTGYSGSLAMQSVSLFISTKDYRLPLSNMWSFWLWPSGALQFGTATWKNK